jgi:hypothetical protein
MAIGPMEKQIARHLQSIGAALREGIETIFARADSGFYRWEAVPRPSSFSFPRIRFTSLRRATRGVERGALSARARTCYSPNTPFASSPGSHRLNQRPSLGTLPMLQVSDVADTRVPNSDLRSFLWRSQWQAGVRPVRRLTSRR